MSKRKPAVLMSSENLSFQVFKPTTDFQTVLHSQFVVLRLTKGTVDIMKGQETYRYKIPNFIIKCLNENVPIPAGEYELLALLRPPISELQKKLKEFYYD